MVKVYFQILNGSLLHSQWWDLTNPYFKSFGAYQDKFFIYFELSQSSGGSEGETTWLFWFLTGRIKNR